MSNIRKAVTSLTLDLSMPDVQAGFTCTLGDRMRVLEIIITDGGRPVEMLPRWSAFLSGVKPDETKLVNGCVVQDGKIIYDFEMGDQIATCAGAFPVTVWIMDENGTPVASPKIWVNVIDSGVQHIIQSKDQFGVLQDIVENINDLFDKDKQIDEDIKNLVSVQSIVVPASTWEDETPLAHSSTVPVPLAGRKTIILYPANDATRTEATRVRLSAEVRSIPDQGYDTTYTVFRSSGKEAPRIDMEFNALVLTEKSEGGSANVIMAGFDTTAEDIDESIKKAKEEIASAKKDISAAKISIEIAKDNIAEAKQDIEDTIVARKVTVPKEKFESGGNSTIEFPYVDENYNDDKGNSFIVLPADGVTREEATKARLYVDAEVIPGYKSSYIWIRKPDNTTVERDLNFIVIRLKDDTSNNPSAALIGVAATSDDVYEAIEEKVTVSTVSITASAIADEIIPLLSPTVDEGDVILLYPKTNADYEKVKKFKISATLNEKNQIAFRVKNAPSKLSQVTFVFARINDDNQITPVVSIVGAPYFEDTPTNINLSLLDDGEVVETFSDGTTKTTTIEYDDDGNPVKIKDADGNETVLIW